MARKPLAQSQHRMEGILCSRTHGPSGAGLPCGRLVWPTCFGRTQPLCLMASSSGWGHDPMRSPGQAPTTPQSPSSGPGMCLTTGVSPLDGHPHPSYPH